jgi:hypothetical protein
MWEDFSNKKLMLPKWDYSKPKREFFSDLVIGDLGIGDLGIGDLGIGDIKKGGVFTSPFFNF